MKQITEDFVSFEIAKLLKEKGFDVPTMYFFNADGNKIKFQQAHYIDDVARPTQSLALKWLREVHRIFISIMCCTYPTLNKVTWIPDITTFESVFPDSAVECDTYEEAVEAALKYTLKNLI